MMRKMCDEIPCPIQGQETGYAVFVDACRGVDALPEAERVAATKRIVLAFMSQALCALSQADAEHLIHGVLSTLGTIPGVKVQHRYVASPSRGMH